jgi:peptide/nickel transport system permease protein
MHWQSILRSASGMVGMGIVIAFVLVALFAPWLAPRDPISQDLRAGLRPPGTPGYPLGTDELGRDLLTRLIYGARTSLAIAASAIAFGVLVGLPLGITAGYYGGAFDNAIMRTADVLMGFPRMLLAIVIVAAQGIGFWSLVLAIGIPDIPIFARLARTSARMVSQNDYVTAARAIGSSGIRIMKRHVAPNMIGPIAVQATFSMAAAILGAGGLSFLGFGVRPPTPEWGAMLAQARSYMRDAAHLTILPGLAISVVILGINLLGDALRQVYDPRFRGRDL